MTPTLSVVVPTMNRADALRRFLDSVSGDIADIGGELVVVSDGSTDATNAMLDRYHFPCDVVVLQQENAGPAAARNRGVGAASAPLIVFLDDDVEVLPGLLERHRLAHQDSKTRRAVFGPLQTPPEDLSSWTRWEQDRLVRQYELMSTETRKPTSWDFYTGNASIPRELFEQVGGFDETYRRAEDVELSKRLSDLGVEFVFDPGAAVLHHAERSQASWLKNAHGGGAAMVRILEANGDAARFLATEYGTRHRAIQAVLRLFVGRPGSLRAQDLALRMGVLADRIGIAAVGQQLLSASYNLGYFDSAARALGGRSVFFDAVENVDGVTS